MHARQTVFSFWLSYAGWVYGTLAAASVVAGFTGCGREPALSAPVSVAAAVEQTSRSCRTCHENIYHAWHGTDHALTNRPVDPVEDAAALATLAARDPTVKAELILGRKPLWQPLVPAAGGRWQAHEVAYDPLRGEAFNVFGDEKRRPGEWGHWTGRGMNWNSMCAHCHMTGYERGYDSTSDTYRSTWVEQGVSCIQCHGAMPDDHDKKKTGVRAPFYGDRGKMMQTCAPCHARNEALTEKFQPGDNYHDHFRVTLPVDAATFYPDGQQRDEDFNWTSVLLSRMGHSGVTCLDCHDPHTNRLTLPTANNQLCLQCHAAPGRVMAGGARALPIDPTAHSRHAEGSAGNSCVACHMPTTTYMQRAPRHDHGWLKPDPLLTKELGIPNACSRCHEDKGIDWIIDQAEAWYGPKLDSWQRKRARGVAAAQAGEAGAGAGLLDLLRTETIPAWRASYLTLLATLPVDGAARAVAQRSLQAQDPLERAAAARYFAGAREAAELLSPLLQDPIRLVRLDAAWVLSPQLPPGSVARKELDDYLGLALDQPAGRMRLGQDQANRGDLAGAAREMARAVDWDLFSPAFRDAHGMVLAASGRSAEAGAEMYRAATLAGAAGGPIALRAGLVYAEAGRLLEAENSLRLAVRTDPKLDRAWYNLGLLLAQGGRLTEAAEAMQAAERVAPLVPDYPYALATILLSAGDQSGARAAALRTRQLTPDHAGANQILQSVR